MKTPLMSFVLLAATVLALPAQAQLSGTGGAQILPQGVQLPPERRHGPFTEGDAEEMRLSGQCDQAMPKLRQIAEGPRSSGIAKFNLGMCLFDLAKAQPDQQKAAGLRRRGAQWVVRAADDGYDKAEKKAVSLYLDGTGVPVDPVEAQKWALIFHRNGMRLALGLPDISADVRDRLDATLSDAQSAEADARASSWRQKNRPLDE